MLRITDTIVIDDRELEEHFVKSSGPGGQNVNKVATAVELRFDTRASSLEAGIKARLPKLAGKRMTADGVIVIHAHEFRTQGLNREAARERLAVMIRQAATRPKKRRATKPGRVAKERRLTGKHKRSEVKKRRGRTDADD